MAESRKLTRFQRKFCEQIALLRSPNASQALRDLGWKGTRPDAKASKMLRLPHVKAYIAKLQDDALTAAGVNRVQIVREMARIAFVDPRKLIASDGSMLPMDKIGDAEAAAIAGLEVEELFEGRGESREHIGRVRKVKLWNKREALSDLAAIAGLKRENAVPTVPIGPGLTVIVQQGGQVNVQQNTQNVTAGYVPVELPPPG